MGVRTEVLRGRYWCRVIPEVGDPVELALHRFDDNWSLQMIWIRKMSTSMYDRRGRRARRRLFRDLCSCALDLEHHVQEMILAVALPDVLHGVEKLPPSICVSVSARSCVCLDASVRVGLFRGSRAWIAELPACCDA